MRKTTLSKALLELTEPAPKDYDIEKTDFEGGFSRDQDANSSENEQEDQTAELRTHYVQVGKSKLRHNIDLSQENPKYGGIKVSRKELLRNSANLKDSDSETSENGDLQDADSSSESESDIVQGSSDLSENDQDQDIEQDLESDEGSELESENDSKSGSGSGYDQDSSDTEAMEIPKKTSKKDLKESQDQDQSTVKRELEKLKITEVKMANDMNKMKQMDAIKGKQVINQMKIWESTLDLRIRFQKILQQTNELPSTYQFAQLEESNIDLDSTKLKTYIDSTTQALGKLLVGIVNIQPAILEMIPSDQLNLSSKKRKFTRLEVDEFDSDGIKALWDKMESNRKIFKHYRDETLLKWDSRVNHLPGNLSSKNLKAFSKNVVEQIDQMMQNKERLLARTRIPRINYKFLIDSSSPKGRSANETQTSKSEKEIDSIYDDTDFYQSLLKDLIDSRSLASTNTLNNANSATSSNSGLQWATMQKSMNATKKRNVDTKASKGRKIRYEVFEKLENFMAPQQNSTFASVFKSARLGIKSSVATWTEEQTKELYSSLIGANNTSKLEKMDSANGSATKEPVTEIEVKAEENMDSIRLFNF